MFSQSWNATVGDSMSNSQFSIRDMPEKFEGQFLSEMRVVIYLIILRSFPAERA